MKWKPGKRARTDLPWISLHCIQATRAARSDNRRSSPHHPSSLGNPSQSWHSAIHHPIRQSRTCKPLVLRCLNGQTGFTPSLRRQRLCTDPLPECRTAHGPGNPYSEELASMYPKRRYHRPVAGLDPQATMFPNQVEDRRFVLFVRSVGVIHILDENHI